MNRTLAAAAVAALALLGRSIITAAPAVAEDRSACSRATGTAKGRRNTTGRCRALGRTA